MIIQAAAGQPPLGVDVFGDGQRLERRTLEAANLTTIQNPGGTNTLTPNGLNQIATLNGVPFLHDANGNLVQDDQRTYRWDAENRLVGAGYNAQPSKRTTVRYDGFGRRIAIVTTDGNTTDESRFLWCQEALCPTTGYE